MKIVTILGTRPEIIRLSIIMQKLDKLSDHNVIHTGQNYSKDLKDIFFTELNLRQPDYYLSADTSNIGDQLAIIFQKTQRILEKISPDKILILGDTNSGLASIIGEKMQIPVYHMEAGNRCYDPLVPEEKNRKIIDAVSTYNLPYTPRSRENLLREGFSPQRIMASGNPINEVLIKNKIKIEKSNILKKLKLSKQKYFIVTAHRAENVDNKKRLRSIFEGLDLIANKFKLPIICSIHPRTKEKMKKFKIKPKLN
jgi:UDP-N-acetylglucosamine 2-epimerase (non-hydrolysing)